MNLPNYFLADLPPEAVLSPALLTEACQTLKRNRELYLAGRSTEQLVKVLSDVAEAWRKPDNTFRHLALEIGPGGNRFFHRHTETRPGRLLSANHPRQFTGVTGPGPGRGFVSRVTCHVS